MPSQSSVSLNQIIKVNGKVVQSTVSGFIPQLLILTQNPLLPTGTVQPFNSPQAVSSYFGTTYHGDVKYTDSINAGYYFKGATKATKQAPSVLFYYYPENNTSAWTRGLALSSNGASNDLTALKEVTAGILHLNFNGTAYEVDTIDLSSDNSFAAMATTIQSKIQAVTGLSTVTCTWDNTTNAFTITYPYDGTKANSVGYVLNSGTGATDQLAQRMKITESFGAILSQGIAAQTPAQVMNAITNLTTNFVTLGFNFDINSDSTYEIVLGIAEWIGTYPNLCVPLFYDTNAGNQSPITNPMQTALINAGYGQNSVTPYTLNADVMYIICNDATVSLSFAVAGVPAAYRFDAPNGIIQLNSCTFEGIETIINNDNDYDLLTKTYGANSYVNLNSRGNNFKWFEKGNIGGNYGWIDTIIGYFWLADSIQVQIAGLFNSLNSIPYSNLSIINAVLDPVFQQATISGVVQKNIPLSQNQKQELIAQAGYDFTSIMYNNGYYVPQVTATAEDIATRTLSNVQAWYTYAGGPVDITIYSTTVI